MKQNIFLDKLTFNILNVIGCLIMIEPFLKGNPWMQR